MDKSKKIGLDGEKQVASVLSKLPSSDFKLYNNILIKTSGGTTQIDHILVSTRGIFVIETKAHKGKIFGDNNSKYWTQCLFGKNRTVDKFKMYSPYKQNLGHLKNIIKLLGTRSICGIICFTSPDVDLSSVICDSVVHISLLDKVILHIFLNSKGCDYNFSDMCNKISSLNIQSKSQEKKHIKYVKSLSK